jgi:hypothetical protein
MSHLAISATAFYPDIWGVLLTFSIRAITHQIPDSAFNDISKSHKFVQAPCYQAMLVPWPSLKNPLSRQLKNLSLSDSKLIFTYQIMQGADALYGLP